MTLHRQTINADDTGILSNDHIRDMVFPRPVRRNDSRNQVLRHVLIVGQKLFRILGQAVATIPKRRIVIEIADSRIEANPFDDFLGTETAHFSIGVEFIKIGDPQSQIRIGKEFYGFGFRRTRK